MLAGTAEQTTVAQAGSFRAREIPSLSFRRFPGADPPGGRLSGDIIAKIGGWAARNATPAFPGDKSKFLTPVRNDQSDETRGILMCNEAQETIKRLSQRQF